MPERSPLEPGGQFMLKGDLFKVLRLPEHGFIFVKNLVTNEKSSMQTRDVWKSWQEGTLSFALRGDFQFLRSARKHPGCWKAEMRKS